MLERSIPMFCSSIYFCSLLIVFLHVLRDFYHMSHRDVFVSIHNIFEVFMMNVWPQCMQLYAIQLNTHICTPVCTPIEPHCKKKKFVESPSTEKYSPHFIIPWTCSVCTPNVAKKSRQKFFQVKI